MSTQRKVVVTGGAGFIGAHLADRLVDEGYDVHVVDNLVAGKREHVNVAAKFHQVDIREKDKLLPIFRNAAYLFHLAALPRVKFSIEHPEETNDVNISGTLAVLEAARECAVGRVIYSSSSSVYGEQRTLPFHEALPPLPRSPYGLQKYVGEHYVRIYSEIHGLSGVSLRYFNVYGPRMDLDHPYALVMSAFIKRMKEDLPLLVTGDGEQTRDFTHVRDVVNANLLAATNTRVGRGETLNIGAGNNISINRLAQMMGRSVEYIPAREEPKHTLADNRRARELLGWTPSVAIEDGVKEFLSEWGFAEATKRT